MPLIKTEWDKESADFQEIIVLDDDDVSTDYPQRKESSSSLALKDEQQQQPSNSSSSSSPSPAAAAPNAFVFHSTLSYRAEVSRRLKRSNLSEIIQLSRQRREKLIGQIHSAAHYNCHLCSCSYSSKKKRELKALFPCKFRTHVYCKDHWELQTGIAFADVEAGKVAMEFCPVCCLTCECSGCHRKLDDEALKMEKQCEERGERLCEGRPVLKRKKCIARKEKECHSEEEDGDHDEETEEKKEIDDDEEEESSSEEPKKYSSDSDSETIVSGNASSSDSETTANATAKAKGKSQASPRLQSSNVHSRRTVSAPTKAIGANTSVRVQSSKKQKNIKNTKVKRNRIKQGGKKRKKVQRDEGQMETSDKDDDAAAATGGSSVGTISNSLGYMKFIDSYKELFKRFMPGSPEMVVFNQVDKAWKFHAKKIGENCSEDCFCMSSTGREEIFQFVNNP